MGLNELTTISLKDIVLVLIVPVLTGLLAFGKYVRTWVRDRRKLSVLEGVWHTYHWSRQTFTPIFRHEKWRIERGWRGISIWTEDDTKKELHYEGRIERESSYVIVHFIGKEHGESWSVRMSAPIPNEDAMMQGVFIGEDFDHENYAAFVFACRKPRGVEDAKLLLTKLCDMSESEHAIRVRKTRREPEELA